MVELFVQIVLVKKPMFVKTDVFGILGFLEKGQKRSKKVQRPQTDFLANQGGGIRTRDLVVERSVCNPTGLYPSLPPSGTQNTLWHQPLQILPNTFRIYPTPSEFTHHLQNSPTTFRKNLFLGHWTFLDLFPKIPRSQKRRFLQK